MVPSLQHFILTSSHPSCPALETAHKADCLSITSLNLLPRCLNLCARRIARSADEWYVPDHPELVHEDSSSYVQPIMKLDQISCCEIDIAHCNCRHDLGWAEIMTRKINWKAHMSEMYILTPWSCWPRDAVQYLWLKWTQRLLSNHKWQCQF